MSCDIAIKFKPVAVSSLKIYLRKYTNFPCTSVFTATTGLPYVHRVDYIREEGLSLPPSDFHPRWL